MIIDCLVSFFSTIHLNEHWVWLFHSNHDGHYQCWFDSIFSNANFFFTRSNSNCCNEKQSWSLVCVYFSIWKILPFHLFVLLLFFSSFCSDLISFATHIYTHTHSRNLRKKFPITKRNGKKSLTIGPSGCFRFLVCCDSDAQTIKQFCWQQRREKIVCLIDRRPFILGGDDSPFIMGFYHSIIESEMIKQNKIVMSSPFCCGSFFNDIVA